MHQAHLVALAVSPSLTLPSALRSQARARATSLVVGGRRRGQQQPTDITVIALRCCAGLLFVYFSHDSSGGHRRWIRCVFSVVPPVDGQSAMSSTHASAVDHGVSAGDGPHEGTVAAGPQCAGHDIADFCSFRTFAGGMTAAQKLDAHVNVTVIERRASQNHNM